MTVDTTRLWSPWLTRDMITRVSHGRPAVTYPDVPASLGHSLAAAAARTPAAVAVVDDDAQTWTYAQLASGAARFGAHLGRRCGVGRGDRVALLMDTSARFVVAAYGASWRGAVVVPVQTKLPRDETVALVRRSGARAVVCDVRFRDWFADTGLPTVCADSALDPAPPDQAQAERLGGEPPVGTSDDDAVVMFTSGTTARSKGVVLTNLNLGHAIVTYQRLFGVVPSDRLLLPVPIYHITGLVAVLGLSVQAGACLVLHRRFDADRVVRALADDRITILHASPTVFAKLLAARRDAPAAPSVRLFACGAAHMPAARIRELHAWLPRMEFRTVFGMTETSSPGFVFPGDAAVSELIGSSGWPIPGLEVRLVAPDDGALDVAAGEIGEIWLRGAGIARCYDPAPDGVVPDGLDAAGWLRTGDLGTVAPEGHIRVVGRIKDMINRGGEKVWAIDVEEALRSLDEVLDAAVVGLDHDVYGEVPAALITVAAGADVKPAGLRARLKTHLARYQIPEVIV
ncbi:MAG: acyl--CoA ligase, partial [Propionibacteriaceae bacterium]|nr:acyl--CoA ligase [Propionibacteriaceae bacterium]